MCEFHAMVFSNPQTPKLVRVGKVVETGFEISNISGSAFDVFNKTQKQIGEASKNIAIFDVKNGALGERLAVELSATGQYRSLDGLTVSGDAMRMLDSLGDSAKIFEKAGKKIAVTGQIFNVLELGNAVYKDLNDVDKKIGVGTLKSATEIVLSEVTEAAFVTVGTTVTPVLLVKIFGAAGTVVAPGVGTIVGAIIGGVLYALVGDALVGKFVDGLFYLVE